MEIQDDRSKEEKITHNWLVVGTDSFMSGWGKARGGVSYAAWACKSTDLDRVKAWVWSRSDMKRVKVCFRSWRPTGIGHAHIYVVHEGHPSIQGGTV